ncbi:MAG: sigma-70 family RNA polymerase sigma factor [Planctomycetes bacterium]|nr:sigma-70 family RNA polymerase sigma factor [Planctomycetota bacterium]
MAATDDELLERIERVKAGDIEALAELFSSFRGRLWRIVRFRLDPRLQRRVDPDDILQEAYLNAAQRVKHFGGDSPTSAFIWFRLIVGQTLIDVHRRHLGAQARDAGREVPIHGLGHPHATSTSMAGFLVGDLTSPSQAAMRREAAEQVEEALERMDPIDREVLALRHFEELTNAETAEALGIQQKAASIRYVRALGRLRGILSKLADFGGESGGA